MPASRLIALLSCLLVLTAGCASAHGDANAPATTAASSSTTDPDQTPNSIPYVAGERIGLPHGWVVTITKVLKPYSSAGLSPPAAGEQYVALDMTMINQGPAAHVVSADALFTLVDGAHREHIVVRESGGNGLDGPFPAGTTRSGRIVFRAPTGEDLGLVLYGPRIGTQVSYFTIVPATVPTNAN